MACKCAINGLHHGQAIVLTTLQLIATSTINMITIKNIVDLVNSHFILIDHSS